jgi:DNA mismatch endonuclease (patch repair protein)
MKKPNELRSRTMRAVKSRDTGPELLVRSLVHRLGYRFRLHRKDLPGSPDLAFMGQRKVVFVHGCFWHGHACTRGARVPKTNAEYWRTKIKKNELRDAAAQTKLKKLGWKTLIIWECGLKDGGKLAERLSRFLAP